MTGCYSVTIQLTLPLYTTELTFRRTKLNMPAAETATLCGNRTSCAHGAPRPEAFPVNHSSIILSAYSLRSACERLRAKYEFFSYRIWLSDNLITSFPLFPKNQYCAPIMQLLYVCRNPNSQSWWPLDVSRFLNTYPSSSLRVIYAPWLHFKVFTFPGMSFSLVTDHM